MSSSVAVEWLSAQAEGGHTYWYNPSTGERSWERPTGTTQNAWMSSAAPSGHIYWYNTHTGERTWERPVGATEQPPLEIKASVVGTVERVSAEAVKTSTSSMSAKIDAMLDSLPRWRGRLLLNPATLRPWLHGQGGPPSSTDPRYWLQVLVGATVYGDCLIHQTPADRVSLGGSLLAYAHHSLIAIDAQGCSSSRLHLLYSSNR